MAAPALGALAPMPRRRCPAELDVHVALSGSRAGARLALRLWRLDRSATRLALRALGVPVLCWPAGTELDGVLASVRTPPPAAHPARIPAVRP